jgi:predicted PilT family ATPase
VNGDVKRTIDVPKEYVGIVVGYLHRNRERIETKSETKIKVPFLKKDEGSRRLKSYYIDKINKFKFSKDFL